MLMLFFNIQILNAQVPVYTYAAPGTTHTDSTQGNNLPAFGQLHVLHVYARFQEDEEVLPGIDEWPIDRKKVPDYAYQWLAQNKNQMPEASLLRFVL